VLSQVSIPEYIRFVIHSLEYKTLVIEQLSEVRERAALALYRKNQIDKQGQGQEGVDIIGSEKGTEKGIGKGAGAGNGSGKVVGTEKGTKRGIEEVEEEEGVDESAVPYGVLLYTCVIRDLSGVGFEHVGAKGQEIIQAVIGVASANYPELMRKCFMINAPWVFNALWYFIKVCVTAMIILSYFGVCYLLLTT
jgi:CRAL/TRIO domain